MDLKILDTLTDDKLTGVIAYSTELLAKRDVERKEKATEDAMAILARAGLTFKDVIAKRPAKKAPSAFKPKADHVYQHPDNPALTATGTGKGPEWWGELIGQGRQPKDMGPVQKPVMAKAS